MTTKYQAKFCQEIAEHYGEEAQLDMLVEECAELIQAVNKYRRSGKKRWSEEFYKLIEEIADVEIMTEQIKHLLFIPQYEISKAVSKKLHRQLERIKGEQE